MNKTLKILALPVAVLAISALSLAYAKSDKQEKVPVQKAKPAPMSCCSAPTSKAKLLSASISSQITSGTAEKKK